MATAGTTGPANVCLRMLGLIAIGTALRAHNALAAPLARVVSAHATLRLHARVMAFVGVTGHARALLPTPVQIASGQRALAANSAIRIAQKLATLSLRATPTAFASEMAHALVSVDTRARFAKSRAPTLRAPIVRTECLEMAVLKYATL
jgi:hypothetical protein